jgi:hypothetical protein
MSVQTVTDIRPLYVIAREILADPAYQSSAWFAGPYVTALLSMSSIRDGYGSDDGAGVVLYALSNLRSYRGDTARRVKAELKAALQR